MSRQQTIHFSILNQRYRGWLTVSASMVLPVCVVLVCGFMVAISHTGQKILLWCAAGSVVAGAVLVAYEFWLAPVERVRIGDRVEIRPRFQPMPPSDIVSVAFARDPMEDYVETPLPIPVCQVTITFRIGDTYLFSLSRQELHQSVQLIVSLDDAVRLGDWARSKQIAVSDSHGFTTPSNAG